MESLPAHHLPRDAVALFVLVALCLAVAAAGGAVTATSVGTWYQTLAKPTFNPPDWLFGPVWTTIYLVMAFAAWRVWRMRTGEGARRSLAVWALQLALNLAWSFIFFGARMIGVALAEIVLLLAAILATTVLFWRIDRVAGALFVPYLAWVSFATVLNAVLWRLN